MLHTKLVMTFFSSVTLLFAAQARTEESTSQSFQQLLDDAWEYEMRFDPLWAMQVGDHRDNDKLPRLRVEDYQRHLAAERKFRKIAENDLEEDIFATPAPVDGQLFIRTTTNLWCVEEL